PASTPQPPPRAPPEPLQTRYRVGDCVRVTGLRRLRDDRSTARADGEGEPEAAGYHDPVRYPVVLFDLDGTLIDSGGMILASVKHAARTVLGREVPDEQ